MEIPTKILDYFIHYDRLGQYKLLGSNVNSYQEPMLSREFSVYLIC
jgi:hypothetical protein